MCIREVKCGYIIVYTLAQQLFIRLCEINIAIAS